MDNYFYDGKEPFNTITISSKILNTINKMTHGENVYLVDKAGFANIGESTDNDSSCVWIY